MIAQMQQQQQQLMNARRQQQQAALQGVRHQQQMANLQRQRQMMMQLQQQQQHQMVAVQRRAAEISMHELVQRMLRNQVLLRQATLLRNTLLQQAVVRDLVRIREEMSKQADRRFGEDWRKQMRAQAPKKERDTSTVASLAAKQETQPSSLSAIPTKVASDEVLSLGTSLIGAPGTRQEHVLEKLHVGKGSVYTKALALAIPLLEDQAQQKARATLAKRLARMKSTTLRNYLVDANAEIRQAAVMACAMKDLSSLIPEIIERLDDSEPPVVGAARSALRVMTKKDFGPAEDATAEDRKSAIKNWKSWWQASS